MTMPRSETITKDYGNGFVRVVTLLYYKWGIFASVREKREGKEDVFSYRRFYITKRKPTHKEVRTEIDIYYGLL